MNNKQPKTKSAEAGETEKTGKAQLSQVAQLLARLQQEVDEARPRNPIHFIVDFLCKHYPEHLKGFAAIWNADPELERERLMVVEFFRAQKLPTEIASHFTNAGFDTLETLCTLTAEALDDIEKFSQTRWLPGHKVRLQQTFADIAGRVRAFTEERDYVLRAATTAAAYCSHPQLISTKPILAPAPAPGAPAAAAAAAAGAAFPSACPLQQPFRSPYIPPSSSHLINYPTELPRN